MRLCYVCLLVMCSLGLAQAQIISNDTPPEETGRKSDRDEYGLLTSNFYITANIGAALPLGKYSAVDISDNNSRYAAPGFDARLNLGIIFKKIVGLTASAGILQHRANIDQFSRRLNLINPGLVVTDMKYKGFKHIYGTAGLLLSFPLKPSISIDLRIQAGFVYGIDESKTILITDGTGIALVEVQRGLDASFLFNPGFSVRVLPMPRLLLMASLDHMLSKYTFRNVKQTINGVNPTELEYKVNMLNISLSFGIGILLK